jgi:hypothetical protein
MNGTRVAYSRRLGSTAEREADALARLYHRAIELYREEKAARRESVRTTKD